VLGLDRLVAGQPRTIVADLPAEAGAVELILQAPDEAAPARVDVHEGWVVGLPETLADVVRTAATWAPEGPPPPAAGNSLLCDGSTYGPAVLTVPVGGEAPATRHAEWPVAWPGSPAMLRGLFGLTADTPPGAVATVSLTLVAPERKWELIGNLEVTAQASDSDGASGSDRNRPAVVEVGLPAEAVGQECKLVMEVSAKPDQKVTLAVPCLRLCAR
jgi:hypothetical protein